MTRTPALTLAASVSLGLVLLSPTTSEAYRVTPGEGLLPLEVNPTCVGQPQETLHAPQPRGMFQSKGVVGPSISGRSGMGASGYGSGSVGSSTKAATRAVPKKAPSPAPSMDSFTASAPPPVMADAMEEAEADDAVGMPDTLTTGGPSVDFGGHIYLSNDDTGSLASPQRLLWALDKNRPFTVGQVRPHELLNYFTFSSARPQGQDTFEVTVSALQTTHDTMDLALAVHGATPARPTMDLTFLVDRSGSMDAADRLPATRRALELSVQQLQPGDRVDLIVFNTQPCTALKNFVVGRDDLAVVFDTIQNISAGGGTNLNRGLEAAYDLSTQRKDRTGRAGRVMLFTDAELNTGMIDPNIVSEIGRAWDKSGVRLTGVGVGDTFRDDVLNKLTEKGKGAYVFLGSDAVVDRLFGQGFDSLVQTIAHDVQFKLDLPNSLGMSKFYGEEASTVAADVQPVSFHAGASQLFYSSLRIHPNGLRNQDKLTLTISWNDPATGRRKSQAFTSTIGTALSTDPRNVQKAGALMAWSDHLMDRAMGGPACGNSITSFAKARAATGADAELAYVASTIERECGAFPEPAPVRLSQTVETRVKVDADTPIGRVDMSCGSGFTSHTLVRGSNVARFMVQPGHCKLTLHGAVPLTAHVDVPVTDSDITCRLRAGRLHCEG